jgi:hypothetical protein
MKKSAFFFALLTSLVGITFAFVGCADKNDGNVTPGSLAQLADSAARDMAGQEPAESSYTYPASAVDYQIGISDLPVISDLYSSGDLVYGAYEDGLVIYNLKTAEHTLVSVDDDLRAIALHNDTLYVGGDHLYTLTGTSLTPIDSVIPGQINDLLSFGPSLMIGADSGLYVRTLDITMPLMENVSVSALAADGGVLWVGTIGDGLFRYDGSLFQQRYLTRDSSLFDNVTALAFNHDHLYLGTDNGMFVYDGGRWETVGLEQGMPSEEIVSIDADGWVVYVGTAGGTVTWYENLVKPVKHLDETIVTSFCRAGNRMIAGTLYDGLAIKRGPAVTLVSAPWRPTDPELATNVQ